MGKKNINLKENSKTLEDEYKSMMEKYAETATPISNNEEKPFHKFSLYDYSKFETVTSSNLIKI
jgi:hypothetical protein